MRIALLTYSTKPRGGVVHTLALAEALAALGEDVEVWALGRGGDRRFYRPVTVPVHIIDCPDVPGETVGERVLRSIDLLGRAFTPSLYDIVHAQDCITANAVGPCVRTVHHLDHFTTPELAACHERALVEPFAHVCVSSAVASELVDGWGISAQVIPNGVDAARFASADGSSWRARFGTYVLTVGGIEPRKGSLDLLEAHALLPEYPLVIAGGETLFDYRDYRAAWEARALELGVAPVVLGPVPHDDLPGLVAGASAFAFPSTKEGFGLAAMEALAAGVPLVVRDLAVFRDIFTGAALFAADAGTLAARLREAVTVPSAERAAAGKALAARHTWHRAALAHRDFYRSQ
ncbi:MSMEG_0565 family glycosyltransferase [Herbidospora mongoliensis]|uniref:MSMEG_0565 family glycosyltransferase n=1 Tax=Herbidospora mongoliensis TaxID=688067 RepID=UPI00082C07A8|nr:MSMEG_0565 family glycosyltransferase [Herbidospora mongoliensis]